MKTKLIFLLLILINSFTVQSQPPDSILIVPNENTIDLSSFVFYDDTVIIGNNQFITMPSNTVDIISTFDVSDAIMIYTPSSPSVYLDEYSVYIEGEVLSSNTIDGCDLIREMSKAYYLQYANCDVNAMADEGDKRMLDFKRSDDYDLKTNNKIREINGVERVKTENDKITVVIGQTTNRFRVKREICKILDKL